MNPDTAVFPQFAENMSEDQLRKVSRISAYIEVVGSSRLHIIDPGAVVQSTYAPLRWRREHSGSHDARRYSTGRNSEASLAYDDETSECSKLIISSPASRCTVELTGIHYVCITDLGTSWKQPEL